MQNEDKKGDGGTANHAPFRRDNTLAVCAMGQKVTQGRANRHERERTPESSPQGTLVLRCFPKSRQKLPTKPGRRRSPQISRKVRSLREWCGCLSLRSVLASICRIRSRVTENCFPTSSKV